MSHPVINTSSEAYLPLESLISDLKDNGFSIKPDDYIEILKIIERFKPATLHEAGQLICPLIATNKEEQSRFYALFDKLIQKEPEEEETFPEPKTGFWQQCKTFFSKKKARYLLLAIPVLFLASWILNIPAIWRRSPIEYEIKAGILFKETRNWQVGDTITLYSSWQSRFKGTGMDWQNMERYPADIKNYPSDSSKIKLEWDLGSGWGSLNKREVPLVTSAVGTKTVMLRMFVKDELVSTDTSSITVCEKLPDIIVSTNYYNGDEVTIGSTLSSTANLSFTQPGSQTAWLVDNDTINKNSDKLEYTFKREGPHDISFIVVPRMESPNCFSSYHATITVSDPDAKGFHLEATQTGSVITPPKKIKNWILEILLVLFIGALIGSFMLRRIAKERQARMKAKAESAFKKPPGKSDDKKPVFEIPVENRQQQLVVSEPGVNDTIRFLLQRTRDESLALHIHQTVQNTIRSGGIPDLVYVNKLRHNDYLVLIDSSIVNSQQLKLFEYLVSTFKIENISIVKYFYRGQFTNFYNEEYPSGHSLKRLAELYRNFTLIIFGNAYDLVYGAYPVIDNEKMQALSDWENKGILTPVAFKDWSVKEKAISEQIILLPADVEGQLRLIKAINEKIFDHKDFLLSEKNFYSAKRFDFNKPAEIRNYLADEDLYQWLCATAIYPVVRWELLIEMGKVVLQHRGCPEKMNYTNLLKLVRINWLHQGFFPEQTRLGLLKELGVAEEIVARKKLIELFELADLHFKDNYFFTTAKKMQEIINKFIIYANDPANNMHYASFKEKFEALWKMNRITDAPFTSYINNADKNPWQTPVMIDGKTVGVGKYFGPGVPSSSLTKWSNRLRDVSGGLLLLILSLSFFGNKIAESGAGSFLGLSTVDSSAKVPVTVDLVPVLSCSDSGIDSSYNLISTNFRNERDLQAVEKTSLGPAVDSPTKFFGNTYNIPYRMLLSNPLTLDINWQYLKIKRRQPGINVAQYPNQGILVLDTVTINKSSSVQLSFTTNRLKVNLSGCVAETPKNGISIQYNDPGLLPEINNFTQALAALKYDSINTSQQLLTDSQQVRYFKPADQAEAQKIAREATTYFKKSYSAVLVPGNPAARFEILIYKKLSPGCTSIPLSQLPSTINEIWKGRINSRLITIDLAKKVLYYSTGDKKNYGTYSIVKACITGNLYRIIVKGNSTFRTLFIKNINSNSFNLSVCQQIFNTQMDAENVDEKICGSYDKMELYYESDPGRIFLPLAPGASLVAGENNKLRIIATSIEIIVNSKKKYTATKRYFENTEIPNAEKQALMVYDLVEAFARGYTVSSPFEAFSGTPFDRSYCTVIVISKDPEPDPCDKIYTSIYEITTVLKSTKICRVNLSRQGLKEVPKELYNLKDLKEVDISYNEIPQNNIDQFQKMMPPGCKLIANGQTVQTLPPQPGTKERNEQEGQIVFKDGSSKLSVETTSLIKLIGETLQKNPSASVNFTAYSSTPGEVKINDKRLSAISTALKKTAKSASSRWSITNGELQGGTQELKTRIINTIKIYYTNFPANFGEPVKD